MNISFVVTEFDVMEGEGVVTLMLEKTEGAIGPVSVRLFTEEGTALGMFCLPNFVNCFIGTHVKKVR